LASQTSTAQPQRPSATGRRFRAFIRRGTGTTVEELRLLPIQPGEVVIRTAASGVCYTIVGQVLDTNNIARPQIPNHSGMGVVEEVGPFVKRVQVGDRVALPGTPECGQGYHCFAGPLRLAPVPLYQPSPSHGGDG
jgi:S-(hydroxymethyl)glutathione dehydrogenase/alcohol dehydrogenase